VGWRTNLRVGGALVATVLHAACAVEERAEAGPVRAANGSAPEKSAAEENAAEPATPSAEVRVVYDRFRIPHVEADDDELAFFGLGYAQARDFPIATLANLWSATGRFAEVAGASVLPRDRRLRALGISERARAQARDRDGDLLDPAVRRLLEAYVDGVNAARDFWLAHPQAIDALCGEEGEAMAFDPVPPWLDPRGADEDHRARLQRLFACAVELEHVLALGVALNGGIDLVGAGYATHTNVWMIRNGEEAENVLMLVDSHQPIKRGGARSYFLQVTGASYRAAGYTMPGYPCVTLGFNDDLAFAISSMPKVPREVVRAGAPFRPIGTTPVAANVWAAELAPGDPPRFDLTDGETVVLEERTEELSYWDVDAGRLRDDPQGSFTYYRVPEPARGSKPALSHAVIDPPPGEPIDTEGTEGRTRAIRFGSGSFLTERNPWEFWIRVAGSRSVGRSNARSDERSIDRETGAAGALDDVLDDVLFCYGRGLLFHAADARGGLEFLWMSRVPVQGEAAAKRRFWREPDPGPLDGQDPDQRWRGFHATADLPHLVDRGGFGERAEAWLSNNGSPHFVRAAGGFDDSTLADREYVMTPEPWKSRRQDRARELVERAIRDGVLARDDLERIALDVQDAWARAFWPLIGSLRDGDVLGEDAHAFVDWVEVFRFEAPDGTPGDEEFLAHPLSQVTVFTSLLRSRFEDALLALDGPAAHEVELAFDPVAEPPSPQRFAADERWSRCRALLAGAVEWTARLWRATLDGADGGLRNRALFEEAGAALARRGLADPWGDPLYRAQADGWPADAPAVAARWGEVHLYALTPHYYAPRPGRAGFRRAFWSLVLPAELRQPFHTAQRPAVFPIGGTTDTLFQVAAARLATRTDALYPHDGGMVYFMPGDFGSQITYLVELRDGRPARARFLAAMGATEITTALAANGTAAGDHLRTTADFARGAWNDFPLDPQAILRAGGARELRLEVERRDADGRLAAVER